MAKRWAQPEETRIRAFARSKLTNRPPNSLAVGKGLIRSGSDLEPGCLETGEAMPFDGFKAAGEVQNEPIPRDASNERRPRSKVHFDTPPPRAACTDQERGLANCQNAVTLASTQSSSSMLDANRSKNPSDLDAVWKQKLQKADEAVTVADEYPWWVAVVAEASARSCEMLRAGSMQPCSGGAVSTEDTKGSGDLDLQENSLHARSPNLVSSRGSATHSPQTGSMRQQHSGRLHRNTASSPSQSMRSHAPDPYSSANAEQDANTCSDRGTGPTAGATRRPCTSWGEKSGESGEGSPLVGMMESDRSAHDSSSSLHRSLHAISEACSHLGTSSRSGWTAAAEASTLETEIERCMAIANRGKQPSVSVSAEALAGNAAGLAPHTVTPLREKYGNTNVSRTSSQQSLEVRQRVKKSQAEHQQAVDGCDRRGGGRSDVAPEWPKHAGLVFHVGDRDLAGQAGRAHRRSERVGGSEPDNRPLPDADQEETLQHETSEGLDESVTANDLAAEVAKILGGNPAASEPGHHFSSDDDGRARCARELGDDDSFARNRSPHAEHRKPRAIHDSVLAVPAENVVPALAEMKQTGWTRSLPGGAPTGVAGRPNLAGGARCGLWAEAGNRAFTHENEGRLALGLSSESELFAEPIGCDGEGLSRHGVCPGGKREGLALSDVWKLVAEKELVLEREQANCAAAEARVRGAEGQIREYGSQIRAAEAQIRELAADNDALQALVALQAQPGTPLSHSPSSGHRVCPHYTTACPVPPQAITQDAACQTDENEGKERRTEASESACKEELLRLLDEQMTVTQAHIDNCCEWRRRRGGLLQQLCQALASLALPPQQSRSAAPTSSDAKIAFQSETHTTAGALPLADRDRPHHFSPASFKYHETIQRWAEEGVGMDAVQRQREYGIKVSAVNGGSGKHAVGDRQGCVESLGVNLEAGARMEAAEFELLQGMVSLVTGWTQNSVQPDMIPSSQHVRSSLSSLPVLMTHGTREPAGGETLNEDEDEQANFAEDSVGIGARARMGTVGGWTGEQDRCERGETTAGDTQRRGRNTALGWTNLQRSEESEQKACALERRADDSRTSVRRNAIERRVRTGFSRRVPKSPNGQAIDDRAEEGDRDRAWDHREQGPPACTRERQRAGEGASGGLSSSPGLNRAYDEAWSSLSLAIQRAYNRCDECLAAAGLET